jgi:hypothetical protein
MAPPSQRGLKIDLLQRRTFFCEREAACSEEKIWRRNAENSVSKKWLTQK